MHDKRCIRQRDGQLRRCLREGRRHELGAAGDEVLAEREALNLECHPWGDILFIGRMQGGLVHVRGRREANEGQLECRTLAVLPKVALLRLDRTELVAELDVHEGQIGRLEGLPPACDHLREFDRVVRAVGRLRIALFAPRDQEADANGGRDRSEKGESIERE